MNHLVTLCGLGLILLVTAAVTAALWLLVRLA